MIKDDELKDIFDDYSFKINTIENNLSPDNAYFTNGKNNILESNNYDKNNIFINKLPKGNFITS
jgi:hypothetical protein